MSALPGSGVEVGGHSHDHLQLDLLPAGRVSRQLRTCKDQLEQETQSEVSSFAYPHGYNRAMTRRLVQEVGFSSACAVKNRISHQDDDRFALSRVMLTSDQSLPFLRLSICESRLPVAKSHEQLRTSLWRLARLVRTGGRPLVSVTDL